MAQNISIPPLPLATTENGVTPLIKPLLIYLTSAAFPFDSDAMFAEIIQDLQTKCADANLKAAGKSKYQIITHDIFYNGNVANRFFGIAIAQDMLQIPTVTLAK